jgi:hypothetical protein
MVKLGTTGSVVGLLTFGTMTSLFSKIGAPFVTPLTLVSDTLTAFILLLRQSSSAFATLLKCRSRFPVIRCRQPCVCGGALHLDS